MEHTFEVTVVPYAAIRLLAVCTTCVPCQFKIWLSPVGIAEISSKASVVPVPSELDQNKKMPVGNMDAVGEQPLTQAPPEQNTHAKEPQHDNHVGPEEPSVQPDEAPEQEYHGVSNEPSI